MNEKTKVVVSKTYLQIKTSVRSNLRKFALLCVSVGVNCFNNHVHCLVAPMNRGKEMASRGYALSKILHIGWCDSFRIGSCILPQTIELWKKRRTCGFLQQVISVSTMVYNKCSAGYSLSTCVDRHTLYNVEGQFETQAEELRGSF